MSIIEAQNLSLKINNKIILKNISFKIKKGNYIGLIGPNGAGKSTLIKVILGFMNPTAGTIKKSPNLKIGYVPQSYTISPVVPISVKEVLLMSNTKKIELIKNLEKVGLTNDFLNKNFHNLSGGQKQRVIIARALCTNPEVLIFDEPLNGIDYETKLKLYDLLSHLNNIEKLTILFVSHEVEYIIDKCHHILCLNKTMHTTCHPLAFAKGQCNIAPEIQKTTPKTSPIHHHHNQ